MSSVYMSGMTHSTYSTSTWHSHWNMTARVFSMICRLSVVSKPFAGSLPDKTIGWILRSRAAFEMAFSTFTISVLSVRDPKPGSGLPSSEILRLIASRDNCRGLCKKALIIVRLQRQTRFKMKLEKQLPCQTEQQALAKLMNTPCGKVAVSEAIQDAWTSVNFSCGTIYWSWRWSKRLVPLQNPADGLLAFNPSAGFCRGMSSTRLETRNVDHGSTTQTSSTQTKEVWWR